MGAIAATKPIPHLRILPLGTLSDERLAELASAGHDDAFGVLYERYRDALSRYCRSIVRDVEDAGDALQNTMLSVLRALQGRGPSGPVRPWLYRIAHNESVSILRRRQPHEELSPETPDRADTERASLTKYRLDALLGDLRALPERQRGALVMRELGGLEYGEIAQALDMSAESARKHVFEARVALHDIAAGRDADCGEIVRQISDGDRRALRARSIRGHLRGCASCSAFERGLRTRRGAFGLVPTIPMVSAGALLSAALHGGGGASTSGLAAGSSLAGGSVAGGSIAAGSMAAGSLLGGGSFAAIKGLAAAGAIAVAGAGVIVGAGINSHVRHSNRAVVAHSSRVPHVRAATTVVPHLAKPARVTLLRPHAARAPSAVPAPGSAATPSARSVQTVASQPQKRHPILPVSTKQAPSAPVPVVTTTPAPTPTPAPLSSSPAPAPTATAAPAPGTTAPTNPGAATSQWINSIVSSALQSAGTNLAAAEAQAQQLLNQAGVAPGTPTAAATIQGLISAILGGHG